MFQLKLNLIKILSRTEINTNTIKTHNNKILSTYLYDDYTKVLFKKKLTKYFETHLKDHYHKRNLMISLKV